MLIKPSLRRIATSSLLLLATFTLGFADTVRLKDGSIIKGRITTFGDGKFVVTMGEGSRKKELSFFASEVESIQFDAEPTAAAVPSNRNASYTEPVSQPKTKVVVTDSMPTTGKPVLKQPVKQSGAAIPPVQWKVKVLADSTSNGWTNSGWVVKKGQRVRISGDGAVSLGKGNSSPASGLPTLDDGNKLLKNVATGALIAVIGDDNNDFIYVGGEREFTASRDGALFLGINEGHLEDNSGAFDVKIEILPDGE